MTSGKHDFQVLTKKLQEAIIEQKESNSYFEIIKTSENIRKIREITNEITTDSEFGFFTRT